MLSDEMLAARLAESRKAVVLNDVNDGGLFIREDTVVIPNDIGGLNIREDTECVPTVSASMKTPGSARERPTSAVDAERRTASIDAKGGLERETPGARAVEAHQSL